MILIVVLISSAATGVYSYVFMNPVYEASTKLIVNKSNEGQGVNTAVDINSVNLNLRLIDTYKEVIKTPRIMDQVIKEHPELELTAEQLIQKVKVSSVNNTQVMTVIVQDLSYMKAANIANAVSQVFQQQIPMIMKVDNVSLLNEALPKENPIPVKPNPKLNIAISIIVSLMIAVGIAFLLEYLDDSIKTEEDVEKYLGLPTLTMIIKVKDEDFLHHGNTTAAERKVSDSKHVTANQ
ncbi:Capsular polysaccharide type 8 biosynthesis protein cap8A [compost metagenome]